MKSNVTLIGLRQGWTHREEVEADTKQDAWTEAYKIAEQWGFQIMRSHSTTIGNSHFVTLYGTRAGGARRRAV